MTSDENTRETFRQEVAKLLPKADVFWAEKQAPFHYPPWELVAAKKGDSTSRVELQYQSDMAEHPIDILANDFVAHLGQEFTKA